MLCKKGTPHCCDAPLFGQGSQTNGKQLPLKLLVLPRHRQPGVIAKSTQGSATLRLGLRRIPIPYVRVTAATLDRSVSRNLAPRNPRFIGEEGPIFRRRLVFGARAFDPAALTVVPGVFSCPNGPR